MISERIFLKRESLVTFRTATQRATLTFTSTVMSLAFGWAWLAHCVFQHPVMLNCTWPYLDESQSRITVIRQYESDINHFNVIGLQSHRNRWNNAKYCSLCCTRSFRITASSTNGKPATVYETYYWCIIIIAYILSIFVERRCKVLRCCACRMSVC